MRRRVRGVAGLGRTPGDDDRANRLALPGGVELHFVEKGQGPPVVLLHGGMGDCHSWTAQVDAWSAHFRVMAYSRRQHSPNRPPPQGDIDALDADVQDLHAFVRLLRTGAAHLVATSYGALVALRFALDHPDAVLSLVLAEPPLHRWACRTPAGASLHAAFMADVWQAAAKAFDRGDAQLALRLLTDGISGRPVFDSLAPRRHAAALRNAGAMKALIRAPDPFPDLDRARVARLAMPTLLVRGEFASPLHALVLEEIAAVMRDASRALIAGAGHGSPHENPEGFSDVVLAFLLRQPRRSGLDRQEKPRRLARTAPHRARRDRPGPACRAASGRRSRRSPGRT